MFFDDKGFRGSPDPFEPISDGLTDVPVYTGRKPVNTELNGNMQPLHYAADYRSKCAMNISPEKQASTRKWMIHKADDIIYLSRKRHEMRMIDLAPESHYGSLRIPGYSHVVECNADRCAIEPVSSGNGIGIYRAEPVPELAGTWTNAYGIFGSNAEGFENYRVREEGGRNTRRG
jgi:hypothetical protein